MDKAATAIIGMTADNMNAMPMLVFSAIAPPSAAPILTPIINPPTHMVIARNFPGITWIL